jgi:hypothetical protein
MAYSELIKNFGKIREYMRQFYVYGFRSRNSYDYKSARSYDNEHRRVESWLGDYMRFRTEKSGKVVFLSVDSRSSAVNPLYIAFKTKSFTDNDIIFHFYILDILESDSELTLRQILDRFDEYLSEQDTHMELDESNVRKKIKEYVSLGILNERKEGKAIFYSKNISSVDISSWSDAVSLFTESDPLGVIGSYISETIPEAQQPFRFKHHYIFRALDSEVVYDTVCAIRENRSVDVTLKLEGKALPVDNVVFPLKIMVSTQTGRQYLLGFHKASAKIIMIRMDNIAHLTLLSAEKCIDHYIEAYEKMKKHLWGVAITDDLHTEKVSMVLRIEPHEDYIASRLQREKRCGEVTKLDDTHYQFIAEVYDPLEMLPWIRTFIGRIESFSCTRTDVTDRLKADIINMGNAYGGERI